MSGPVKCIHYRLPFLSFRPYRMRPISGICVCIVSEVSVHLTSVSSASPQSRTFLVFSSLSAYLRVLSGLLWPTLDSGDSNLPKEPGNAACVAGRRKEGRKVKIIFSRFTRSSFPFPSPSDACHAGYGKRSMRNHKGARCNAFLWKEKSRAQVSRKLRLFKALKETF